MLARSAILSRIGSVAAWLAVAGIAPAALVVGVPAASAAHTGAGGGAGRTASRTFPPQYAAPYLQVATSDVNDMFADKSATGLAYYTLAFLTPRSGCTPMWEDGNYPLSQFTSQVKSLQSQGGNVIISFGGASGGEIAETCHSVTSLEAAYAKVVDTYRVNRLDFDIEGNYLNNKSANSRRDQALAELQAADPSVQVDWTLPVAPDGLQSNAIALLQDAKSEGVKVNLVNIMIMDFGNGQNPLTDGESAAKATVKQLARIYTGLSSSQLWAMIGLTPIAGKNDDNEVFTRSDASSLESFAASNGVQELSFWEVDAYDKPTGYAYSRIFVKI